VAPGPEAPDATLAAVVPEEEDAGAAVCAEPPLAGNDAFGCDAPCDTPPLMADDP